MMTDAILTPESIRTFDMARLANSLADVPPLGAHWPGQGGLNGGLRLDKHGKPYWLIVSGLTFTAEWGGYGKREPGAECEFDGMANTIALCESKIEHPAAQLCRAHSCDGHQDFFLMSKRDAATLYANVPHLFKGWHWTSTHYSANGAWAQYFVDGTQDTTFKDGKASVRAVRSQFIL
jgi:hypothetical protein